MKPFTDAPSRSFHWWSQRCIPMHTELQYLSSDMLQYTCPPLLALPPFPHIIHHVSLSDAVKVKYVAKAAVSFTYSEKYIYIA